MKEEEVLSVGCESGYFVREVRDERKAHPELRIGATLTSYCGAVDSRDNDKGMWLR
jgi:hypothetical protein